LRWSTFSDGLADQIAWQNLKSIRSGARVALRGNWTLGAILGVVLLYSAFLSTRLKLEVHEAAAADPLAERLKLDSSYPTRRGWQPNRVQRVKTGFGVMFGSGALKVLAMDHAMRIPFKVSTATSSFMIGVTA
jgi:uncharacterized membrane protein YfcA